MINQRRIVLALCLVCATHTAAFYATPSTPVRSTAIRGGSGVTQSTNRLERSASYSDGDSSPTPAAFGSTTSKSPAFGWTKRAGSRRQRGARAPQRQDRQDWSKLFANPEPEPVQGRPLSGLSRSFGAVASKNMGSSAVAIGMIMLTSTFSPLLAARPLAAWGLGRLTYWLSMRDEDVSVRVSAGFVGYASLFLMVGGQLTVNGLKCISTLSLQ